MAQQTAVEWLKKEVEEYGYQEYLIIRWTDLDELMNQAKQMEKEQIMDAYIGLDKNLVRIPRSKIKDAEQYYNETYGTTNSNEVTDQHLGKHQEPGS